eukprot:scaffold96769_cov63-Cyclotella_meneghiniana.AAC.4
MEEWNEMLFERMERFNDPAAINMLGVYYKDGENGFSMDRSRAVQLWIRASELGSIFAHYNLGLSYANGRGVEQNMRKANHHWQIAAMLGHENSRYNLGISEENNGNIKRAMRHYIIAAKCGDKKLLAGIKKGFVLGIVTKDDFEDTLRCHKASCDEVENEQRNEAKAIMGVL